MGTDETVIRDVFAQILASDGGNVVVEGGGAAAGALAVGLASVGQF